MPENSKKCPPQLCKVKGKGSCFVLKGPKLKDDSVEDYMKQRKAENIHNGEAITRDFGEFFLEKLL